MKVTPKTQKAKGVLFGLDYMKDTFNYSKQYHSLNSMWYSVCVPRHSVITNKNQLDWSISFPVFARPCPKVPRHGFVDSKVITTRTNLKKLFREVKKADPHGEMLLGPYLKNVTHNAVYVNSGNLSVGPGNDGATGGNKSISIPVAPFKFPNEFIKKSGLNKKDAVYLESVCTGGYYAQWNLVQARGGPAIDSTDQDYIPTSMVVKHVVKPNNNLLKWEQEVAKFKPGTVVYANGHTLASHAAIHCIINKVPFITTHCPNIGDTLRANQKKKAKISRIDFKRGIKAGNKYCKGKSYKDMRQLMLFSLSVLHNWAYIKQSPHASWMLGSASVIFLKLCSALVFGEHRHKYHHGRRDFIYENTLHKDSIQFNRLAKVLKDFYYMDWAGGFGGVPWATCTWYTFKLWQEIARITNRTGQNLTDNEISRLIGNINKTTNIAHNNGWWFNKFCENTLLDFVAKYPGMAFFTVADVVYDCHCELSKIKVAKAIKKVRKPDTPFVVNKDGNIRWLAINSFIGSKQKKSITLRCFGEKGYTTGKVNISKKENIGIANAYARHNKSTHKYMVIPVDSRGRFKLPGSKRIKNIKSIFDKKWVRL
jgi:hypothetical protein